jgi:hypothetical protein
MRSVKRSSTPLTVIGPGRIPFLFRACLVLFLAGAMASASGCGRRGGQDEGVRIGRQVWMTANLDTGAYRNGDPIREAGSVSEWNDAISKGEGAWCRYDNDSRNGRLYNWYAVNDPRGLAPSGWRVPSDGDWAELESATGGKGFATGFTGSRNCLGMFFGKGSTAFFWSSTPAGEFDAWDRESSEGTPKLVRVSVARGLGLSVRCVKERGE